MENGYCPGEKKKRFPCAFNSFRRFRIVLRLIFHSALRVPSQLPFHLQLLTVKRAAFMIRKNHPFRSDRSFRDLHNRRKIFNYIRINEEIKCRHVSVSHTQINRHSAIAIKRTEHDDNNFKVLTLSCFGAPLVVGGSSGKDTSSTFFQLESAILLRDKKDKLLPLRQKKIQLKMGKTADDR